MFHILSPLRGVLKSSATSVRIDNTVFRLHYRVTVTGLVAASLLITARQYFGEPINCLEKEGIPPTVLDTYCWLHGTYSSEAAWRKAVGREVAYPGVDRGDRRGFEGEGQTPSSRTYHGYYQWVWAVLALQALFFYLPHYLWKSLEGGLTRNLTLDLGKAILKEEEKAEQLHLLTEYLHRAKRMGLHRRLPTGYLICELLNCLNVVLQAVAIDQVLGGRFLGYGLAVLQNSMSSTLSSSPSSWPMAYDPMLRVFPRVSKCEYFQFGSSGEVESLDTICLLPVNIFNEKVFLLLWYWLLMLAVLSVASLLYTLITAIILPAFRIALHRLTTYRGEGEKTVVDGQFCSTGFGIGDTFVLALLEKNLNPLHYHDLLICLEEEKECTAELCKEKVV